MGTWPYMAPEQFLGQAVDARTDVFAFGVVLYEMLAGQRPFRGESAAAVMAGVLEREPLDLTSAAPSVPRPLARLVEKCLAKSADARWQSMRDLGDALRWVEEDLVRREARSSDAVVPQRRWWLLLVPLAIGLAIGVGWVARAPSPLPDTAVMRLTIPTGDLDTGQVESPEISPDGRLVVFGARPRAGGPVGLYVYDFASATTRRIEGTESAQYPFWSADSRSVGFFADGGVSRVDVAGGAPQVIVERGNDWGGTGAGFLGASWSKDDVIVASFRYGLYKFSARGGQPQQVTTLDRSRQENSHRWPQFLPDGQRFVFVARSGYPDKSAAFVGFLDSRAPVRLFETSGKVRYAGTGHILSVLGDALTARSLDETTLRLGEPYDRTGHSLDTLGTQDAIASVRISPDGRRVAFDRIDNPKGGRSVWVEDIATLGRSRVTFGEADEWLPIWSRDGTRVLFASYRNGPLGAPTVASSTTSNQAEV